MQKADSEFISALAARGFGEYARAAAKSTLSMAEGSAAVTLVACQAERASGFAVLELDGEDSGYLAAIAVAEEFRGMGVGRLLLSAVEREACRRGRTSLRLVTSESNVAALDLFLKAGMLIERRLRKYYPRGQDAVLLRKRLSRGK